MGLYFTCICTDRCSRSYLCIPTAFCSYTGEALDQKTPFFVQWKQSMTQALRLLRLFGNTTSKKVTPSVGPEQEYFLVDAEKFMQRKDLIYTGRTLFGAMPPKGQELDDHYFGTIRQRLHPIMKDVNIELWKVGVSAKTQHNELHRHSTSLLRFMQKRISQLITTRSSCRH